MAEEPPLLNFNLAKEYEAHVAKREDAKPPEVAPVPPPMVLLVAWAFSAILLNLLSAIVTLIIVFMVCRWFFSSTVAWWVVGILAGWSLISTITTAIWPDPRLKDR